MQHIAPLNIWLISLSTVVLNSRDQHEKHSVPLLCALITHLTIYRIEQNFGGKSFWRNCDFETLPEKTLANPRVACIFIIVHA